MKRMTNQKSMCKGDQIISSDTNEHSDSYYTDYYKSRTINHDSDDDLYPPKQLHTSSPFYNKQTP